MQAGLACLQLGQALQRQPGHALPVCRRGAIGQLHPVFHRRLACLGGGRLNQRMHLPIECELKWHGVHCQSQASKGSGSASARALLFLPGQAGPWAAYGAGSEQP